MKRWHKNHLEHVRHKVDDFIQLIEVAKHQKLSLLTRCLDLIGIYAAEYAQALTTEIQYVAMGLLEANTSFQ